MQVVGVPMVIPPVGSNGQYVAAALPSTHGEGSNPGTLQLAPADIAPAIPCVPARLCRDIPVSWFAARENAFNDPSHEIVLHHGAGPFLDRGKAQPRTVKRTAMHGTGYTIRWVAAKVLGQ
jgi:hypothetical protein